jgi:hypothetical protein
MTTYTTEGFDFKEWPKIPRHEKSTDLIITEKIDGTNAAIHVREYVQEAGTDFIYPTEIVAQSRTRLLDIDSGQDNFGFARWVYDNSADLVRLLGVGTHYGEWYGAGIQRGYGMKEKRFALFGTEWQPYNNPDGTLAPVQPGGFGMQVISEAAEEMTALGLEVVPVLYRGKWSDVAIQGALGRLQLSGSQTYGGAGFESPEGIVLLNRHSQTRTKIVFDNQHKSEKPGYQGRDRDDNPIFDLKRKLTPSEVSAMRNSPEARAKREARKALQEAAARGELMATVSLVDVATLSH